MKTVFAVVKTHFLYSSILPMHSPTQDIFSKSWPHAEKEQERGSEREIKNAMACYRTGLTKTPSVCHVMKYMAQPTHNGYIPWMHVYICKALWSEQSELLAAINKKTGILLKHVFPHHFTWAKMLQCLVTFHSLTKKLNFSVLLKCGIFRVCINL